MNTNERKSTNEKPFPDENQAPKKTIYDGIKITKRGMDIIIALLSFALMAILTFALTKSV